MTLANSIITGDSLTVLRTLPDESVQCCITSPPYWGLRNYGVGGQLGLEKTPEEYTAKMVEIFREVRRVLKPDGTLWLNLGDSYASGKGTCYNPGGGESSLGKERKEENAHPLDRGNKSTLEASGLKPKDLVGIPWMVAFALRADGWYLRSDIIWSKPNPMPESVTDRPTKAHEYIFLMSKSARYYYNANAIKEPASEPVTMTWEQRKAEGEQMRHGISQNSGALNRKASPVPRGWDTSTGNGGHIKLEGNYKPLPETQANIRKKRDKQRGHSRRHAGFNDRWDEMERAEQCSGMRNVRSVWTIATQPFKEAHFATYPQELVKRCLMAGTKEGDMILDPFMGSGTTAVVARNAGRHYLGIELNPAYIEMAEKRLTQGQLI